MSPIAWNDDFATGIASVDAQHQRLFRLADQITRGLEKSQGGEALAAALQGLVQYIQEHFSHEEALLRERGYPDYETHLAEHDLMRRQVAQLWQDQAEDPRAAAGRLVSLLRVWLSNHILDSDLAYAPFLNAKGVS